MSRHPAGSPKIATKNNLNKSCCCCFSAVVLIRTSSFLRARYQNIEVTKAKLSLSKSLSMSSRDSCCARHLDTTEDKLFISDNLFHRPWFFIVLGALHTLTSHQKESEIKQKGTLACYIGENEIKSIILSQFLIDGWRGARVLHVNTLVLVNMVTCDVTSLPTQECKGRSTWVSVGTCCWQSTVF